MRRVVFNQKGGVGKSTITCNLAAISAASGKRTLVIDLDTQGNSSNYLLGKAADLSKELGGHVKTLVMAIMKFLGKSVKAIAEASVAFLRWVLELLFSTLRNTAERALQFIGS